MPTIVGRNLKLEVALTFETAAAFTSVSKAFPGVAGLTAHGLTDGEVGYWVVPSGMVELDSQAIMVDGADTDDLELAGLDTTNYSTFTAGNLIMAATWGLIDEGAGYAVGGGASDQLDDSRLHLGKRSNIAGLNAAEDISFTIRTPEVEGAALAFLMRAARNGNSVLVKATKGTRIVRVAYGVPSVYGEQVDVGGLGNGTLSLTCPAYVIKPNV